ncbi:phosphoribosylanthranilate isomerase [uncultured Salinisphaera sp.]|uniref:phosphoribosylanthranilate isomerase n=1 Tax=uncultured Salinisphaera sp. TaxID=359372 RepID=UPI0032B172DE|tara:strand:- start:3693 stop:4325 length:633 start_codon:yes stop_codon:yes gene_type:complete
MSHVRTKICGLCSVDDARAAVTAGADALGFVFTSRSSRRVDARQAAEMTAHIGPFVSRVALFMDDDATMIDRVLETVAIDVLQFHGSESAAFCRSFGKPYMKALAMGEGTLSLADSAADYPDAAALLLDGHRAGQAGGLGQTFDWQTDISALPMPVVAAGGLHADNVGEAIAALRPYAVDVSSGVETAPGRKSAEKMHAFIDAVQKAGQS